jgi:hypothetical protein
METNKEAYIRYDPEKETAWIKAILRSLKDEGRDYYKVESLQLVTMLLIVISKKSHQPHISEVSKTYAGVGLMNMMVKSYLYTKRDISMTLSNFREIKEVLPFAFASMTVTYALSRVI